MRRLRILPHLVWSGRQWSAVAESTPDAAPANPECRTTLWLREEDMIMSDTKLHCEAAAETLRRILTESVHCTRQGDALILDTPYSFGDGNFLRIYLYETEEGIVVSDGGFAAKQVEMLSPAPTTRNHYRRLHRLAGDHGLHWDGRLSFIEPTLEDALYRLGRLALALHETELLLQRGQRPRMQTREYLRRGLESRYGITTRSDHQIVLPSLQQPVIVDILAESDQHQAAIEIIEARTEGGLRDQVNRSAINLILLERGRFDGMLISVYDEEVLNRDHLAIERFKETKPDRAILIPREQALEQVSALLHAA